MAVDAAEILTPSIVNGLPSGWTWKRLDSVCEGVFDCPHSTPLLTQDGPLIARSQDMRSGVFRTDEAGHVSDETYRERVVRAEPKYGDLLYSREGTYFGIAAEVPREIQVCLGQRMVLLRPHANKVDFRFLRCWLNSPVMSMYVHGFRDGTVAERLNLPTIRALPVAVPPLPEERAIAHILGTLDDKIELNRRMNETLEAMARAIFKSWFVDFDPVRAKAEGRDPGLPKHIADLFPDRFEDSQLGEIPAGWRVSELPQEIDFLEGPGLRNWQYRDKGMKFLNIRCIENGDLDVGKANSITLEEFERTYKHFALCEDDIVISTSGTLGRLAIVRSDHLPVMLNTSIIRMRGRRPVNLAYVWAFLQSEYFLEEMFAHAAGSVQLNFGPMHLKKISMLRPPDAVLSWYEDHVQPVLRRILNNRKESRTLATFRDALLPKLISGELRVRDAERFIGRDV